MDDCSNPYLIMILIGMIVVLVIALCILAYMCRKSIAKEIKKKS